MDDLEQKLMRLKKKYDKAELEYKVAAKENERIVRKFDEMGLEIDNVKDYIDELTHDIAVRTEELNKVLDDIDASLEKID